MTAGASPNGEFFAIDARIWAKVIALGMNEAVAYLVLACGTGRGNKATSWSTNAVMKYACIGWARAKPAIVNLVAGGFIRHAESYTEAHPRYELASYQELIAHEASKNPPAKPDFYEQEILSGLQAGRQPTNKTDCARAKRLCERGILRRESQGVYKLPEPVTQDSGDSLIWLPNAMVTGTPNCEESPVQRLRSAGDLWTLGSFVDLYSVQNLRDDGGISPQVIRRNYERTKVGEQGPYIVWGFKPTTLSIWLNGPFAAHRNRPRTKLKDNHPVWDSVDLMERMGLLSFVPHIFENDTSVAEPIHVYGIGETAEAPIEREIGDAADHSARAMSLPSKLAEATENGFQYFCPILKTTPSAQMFGVARLTYRPRTRRTKTWFAELHQTAPG